MKKWEPVVQSIIDSLVGDRVSYEWTRNAIIFEHGYDVFRELQCEAFERMFSWEAFEASEQRRLEHV